MSHHTVKGAYRDLVARLNKFPQGAPPSELLYRILALLFTEREAALVALLPLRPTTVAGASRIWNLPVGEAASILERLASRGLLLDLEQDDTMIYLLPPPMAGFFEFSLMRVRGDLDQKALSELLFQYLNVEEDFIRDLFDRGETSIGRIFVDESAVAGENSSVILDHERASEVIRTARHLAVGLCYCRHKMSHLGKACAAPLGICMTLNHAAASLIRHGAARRIDVAEGLDLLQEARERNLVQCGDNVREDVNFICHCCGCCCEPLIAARRLAPLQPIYTTNFLPAIERESCSGCGRCIDTCPIAAVAFVPGDDPALPGKRMAELDIGRCLGCGVCVRVCPAGAVRLQPRGQRVITPVNSAHRVVLMAMERGTLQELIFDNQAHLSHRVMAQLLGAILKLPPARRLLANRQLKSRYLERLFTGVDAGRLVRKG